ncbi:MAG: alpha/beta hydrolase [Alphaproteobacteria bacterium]|nr:alpha/beta hydrolase [Alphaproteobacteria bacterium]
MMDTVDLVHEDKGNGAPVLVLIHGLCCDHSDWQPQFETFSKSRHVITPTLRGHGRSPRGSGELSMEKLAGDVVALLRAKGVTEAIVGGHSMGTRVTHEVRHQAPDLVKGMILVDGSDSAFGELGPALEQFEAATRGDKLKPWLRGLFEIMFFNDRFADLKRSCVERALAVPDENVRSLYRNMMTWDATKGDAIMRAVDVPTLVLQSTTRGDDGIRRALKEGELGHYPGVVASRIPDAEIALLPDHGHFTGREAPEWTNETIAGWMKANGWG